MLISLGLRLAHLSEVSGATFACRTSRWTSRIRSLQMPLWRVPPPYTKDIWGCTGSKSESFGGLGAGWLAGTGCLFKNGGAATKSRVVSTTNSTSIRSIKTAHCGGRAPRSGVTLLNQPFSVLLLRLIHFFLRFFLNYHIVFINTII